MFSCNDGFFLTRPVLAERDTVGYIQRRVRSRRHEIVNPLRNAETLERQLRIME